jgi:glycyl-tRNA synthetase beta chain
MKKTESLLIEIGCEEIPARFVSVMSDQLRDGVINSLRTLNLSFDESSITSFSTYRRFSLLVNAVQLKQDDQIIEMIGPPLAISKNDKGEWTVPALKFAEKCLCDVSELKSKKDNKNRDVLFFERKEDGRDAVVCLSEFIPSVMQSFHLPIAMRWGSGEHLFIRPVHWVVALLGEVVIPFSVFDCNSSNVSKGQRILFSDKDILIKHPETYIDQLLGGFVEVKPEKRRSLILEYLNNNSTHYDKSLLEEVVNLVEWPYLLEGEIEDKYLSLPVNVITETMKKHQKYFPLYDGDSLKKTFLVVADNVTEKNKETIIKGNCRVLRARLEDALFFWNEDLATSLRDNVEALKKVIFQEGLGSLFEKKERIKKLAHILNRSQRLNLDLTQIDEAADLCKADLVSSMVGEFASLQGQMGELYAEKEGVSGAVSKAISGHYMPLQSGGVLPEDLLSSVIGIADRVDSIVASFFNNKIPTGSKDPLGIRRAIYTVLEICTAHSLNINISELFTVAYSLFGAEKNRDKLESFFFQRLKNYLEEIALPFDSVDCGAASSILENSYTSVLHFQTMNSVFEKRSSSQFKILIETAVRVKRLSMKLDKKASVDPSFFVEDIEKVLWTLFNETGDNSCFKYNDILPAYFESILVMDKNEAIKLNRLSQVSLINDWYQAFADFEKIKL